MIDVATWGTVGQWVSAVGTTSAFLATFYVIKRDAKVRRENHVRKVAFYRTDEKLNKGDPRWKAQGDWFVQYTIVNLADEPIYNATLFASDDRHRLIIAETWPVLLPGSEVKFAANRSDSDVTVGRLGFRDNSGRTWIRTSHGRARVFTRREWWRARKTNSRSPWKYTLFNHLQG